VFGVGQHDGFHYYVMQLIDGVGLDRVLAKTRIAGQSTNDGRFDWPLFASYVMNAAARVPPRPAHLCGIQIPLYVQVTVADPATKPPAAVLSSKATFPATTHTARPSGAPLLGQRRQNRNSDR